MTESTVVVLGLTPTGELHECEQCHARWDVPLGSDVDDIVTREYRLSLVADHVCDPFVDPAAVLSIRQRGDELAEQLGPCPVNLNASVDEPFDLDAASAYLKRVRPHGEQLAFEIDSDLATLSVAKCCGGWTSEADDIIEAAFHHARRSNDDPRRRALQLARHAVYQELRRTSLDPRYFRPSDVRLAMTLIGEVRGGESVRLELSDADALAWLEGFERDACGTL